MNKKNIVLVVILLLGIVFKLVTTIGGNFLFNMDNARDLVEVREMLVLKKPRLTGPTSAIEGLFTGPVWYYLLAIPLFLSGGDPYSTILEMIIFWAIGGFFLLKLVSKWSRWLIIPIGILWIGSDYISLTTFYAFNPNPITLLTPLFIYLFYRLLKTKKAWLWIFTGFLAGLFFNFEMNFGIMMPVIILASLALTGNINQLKTRNFWLGVIFFVVTLLPQVYFDFKHQWLMSKSVLNYLSHDTSIRITIWERIIRITNLFYNTFAATLMNRKDLTILILFLAPSFLLELIKKNIQQKEKDQLLIITLCFIFIPYLLYSILPVTVNPWHLGGVMAATIIFIAYLIQRLARVNILLTAFSILLSGYISCVAIFNIVNFFIYDIHGENNDPSLFKNEISAIDYVYKKANGENFKAYIYMPSVIDYPYQYLFWWYGKKKYGYIPYDYAYSPNKPEYIKNKKYFEGSKDNYNGLVFLIKEPDRINYRSGWEADYRFMKSIAKEQFGDIEIETKREALK